jgi:hypothetical protein
MFAAYIISPTLHAIWNAIAFDYWTRFLAGFTVYWSVTGTYATFRFLLKRYRRRRFKRVFGSAAQAYDLVFAALEVHPAVVNALQPNNPQLARFPLAKPGRPQMAFSAQKVVSSCEIRAVTYLESSLASNAGITARTVADDSVVQRLDFDFISLGATSNLKTNDIFGNAANNLADYDPSLGFFVLKTSNQPVCAIRAGYDYGIILKIHPTQFPRRTWIACAGLGEWGTSGSAWFLANKWHEIEKKVHDEQPFLCVIEVRVNQDESATLISTQS